MPHTLSSTRRRLLGWAGSSVLLAACQTAPSPPTSQAVRNAELQRLGFVRTADGWEYDISGKLLFDTSSDVLDPETQATASRIGKALAQLGIDHLRVEGHTDNIGTPQFNYLLSLRRAEAVARMLASQGLPLARMQVRGLGKDHPVEDNDTPEGRLQNRRVAVIVPGQ